MIATLSPLAQFCLGLMCLAVGLAVIAGIVIAFYAERIEQAREEYDR